MEDTDGELHSAVDRQSLDEDEDEEEEEDWLMEIDEEQHEPLVLPDVTRFRSFQS